MAGNVRRSTGGSPLPGGGLCDLATHGISDGRLFRMYLGGVFSCCLSQRPLACPLNHPLCAPLLQRGDTWHLATGSVTQVEREHIVWGFGWATGCIVPLSKLVQISVISTARNDIEQRFFVTQASTATVSSTSSECSAR